MMNLTIIENKGNGSSQLSDDFSNIHRMVSVIVPIFFGIIAITGLIGNSLVILVVTFDTKMRSTTNLLIGNLAVADLLFIVFCIPFTATDYALSIWPFGEIWCKTVQYLIVVTVLVSIYTLVLMSFDRFLAVVHPVRSRNFRTEYNVKIAIGLLWLIQLIIAVPVFISHGLLEYIPDDSREVWKSCRLLEESYFATIAYHVTFMLLSYVLPLILISCLYLRMVTRLWKTMKSTAISRESQKGRRRVTRLVIVVVIAFAALWAPIQIILLLKNLNLYEPDTKFKILFQIIAHILGYTSSCINPLLYAFLAENFRRAFRKVVCFTIKDQHQYRLQECNDSKKTSHSHISAGLEG